MKPSAKSIAVLSWMREFQSVPSQLTRRIVAGSPSEEAKTEEAYAAQRQNHQAFLPNRLAGKRGNQMRGEAKTRKHGNVDFGLREKPEEALPKNGNSIRDGTGRLIGNEIQRGEKMRAQKAIREQAGAGRQEDAENQHAEDGVDEPRPHGDGHTRE